MRIQKSILKWRVIVVNPYYVIFNILCEVYKMYYLKKKIMIS